MSPGITGQRLQRYALYLHVPQGCNNPRLELANALGIKHGFQTQFQMRGSITTSHADSLPRNRWLCCSVRARVKAALSRLRSSWVMT